MMSIRSILMILLLACASSQDSCQCDEAVSVATADISKEKDELASHLSSIESAIVATQAELQSCEVMVTKKDEEHAASRAVHQSKMDELIKQKESLEEKTASMEILRKELEENRSVMNAAAEKAKQIEEDLLEKVTNERELLKIAEADLVEAYVEMAAATRQLEEIKEVKASRYFHFGTLWGEFSALLATERDEIEKAFDSLENANEDANEDASGDEL